MTFEKAQEILKENGLAWEVQDVVSERSYHFIRCKYNNNRYTLVYNDKMNRVVKMTMEV